MKTIRFKLGVSCGTSGPSYEAGSEHAVGRDIDAATADHMIACGWADVVADTAQLPPPVDLNAAIEAIKETSGRRKQPTKPSDETTEPTPPATE